MKILTFTSLFPNQAKPAHGIFIYQRMSHFARRSGNSVVAVAPVPYFPSWLPSSTWKTFAQTPRREQIGNLTVYHPRYLLVPRISMPLHGWLMFLGSYLLVRRLHHQFKFDCIDSHYVYPDGFAALLLGRLLGLPVFVSARGTDMNLFPSFRFIRSMIRWTLDKVAGAIAVCTPLQEAMLEMGLPREKARVIGNGVDLQRFSPVEPELARKRLGMPAYARILVSVGELIPRKGYHLLIPAFAKLRSPKAHLRLYIVGAGSFKNYLEALIDELHLQGRVVLAGAQANEELKFWYSAADLTCLTSSREGWPNVLLESMACGTPVLATRVWGVPEVISSPELGVMVEQDVESIAAGLEIALSKPWNRALIMERARQRTWDVVAAEVAEFFTTRLGGVARSSAKRSWTVHAAISHVGRVRPGSSKVKKPSVT